MKMFIAAIVLICSALFVTGAVDDAACELPIEAGTCDPVIPVVPSWGYNSDGDGACEAFDYSGCQGNANRWVNETDCATTCLENGCDDVPCATPACSEGTTIETTELPGRCCPHVDCVSAANSPWVNGFTGIVGVVVAVLVVLIG